MDIFDLFWNLGQQQRINRLEQEASFAKGDAQTAAQAVLMNIVVPMERRLEHLSLICRAMWCLIRERTELTESDLARRITDLDAMDGQLDGRVVKPPLKCPKCESMVSRKFNRCLFCGYVPPDESPFDSV